MKRFFVLFLIVLFTGLIAAWFLLPWEGIIERRVLSYLRAQGVENMSFTLDSLGLHGATINNVSIGAENPILLESVTFKYAPKELLEGNLRDISLSGLSVQLIETEDGWKIAGTEGLMPQQDAHGPGMILTDIVNILPFDTVQIVDSRFEISGRSLRTSLPFSLTLTKAPETKLEMTVNASNLASDVSDVALGALTIEAKPDISGNWAGNWSLESIDFSDALPLPVLAAKGDISYVGSMMLVNGGIDDKAKTHKASFEISLDTKNAGGGQIKVTSASFPFKGGLVSSKNFTVPFDRKQNVTVNLNIQKVSLNELMDTLTKGRVSATGTVSGTVPLIVRPDGSYTFGKGSLKADDKGLLQMPGEIIPGDTEQMALVRQILENLHYSIFSAGVDTSEQGLIVRLSLEGNNPDVYGGRAVKLNINLTGDVLDFIQQNAMLITKPEQFLKQGTP